MDQSATLAKVSDLLDQAADLVSQLKTPARPAPAEDPAPALLPQPEPTPDRKWLVAVVVGHEPTKPGACNRAKGICEYAFNNWIAERMMERKGGLAAEGIQLVKVHRQPEGYSQLPAKVNALRPDLVLSLHANGYDGEAHGTEMLYATGSTAGRRFAEILQERVLAVLGLTDRGTKARVKSDRGAHLLFGTAAPTVIAEPFFIDSDEDFAVASERGEALVSAYLQSIRRYFDLTND